MVSSAKTRPAHRVAPEGDAARTESEINNVPDLQVDAMHGQKMKNYGIGAKRCGITNYNSAKVNVRVLKVQTAALLKTNNVVRIYVVQDCHKAGSRARGV